MPPREDPGENEPGGDAGATARSQRGPRGRAFRVTERDDRGKPRPGTEGPLGLTRPILPAGWDEDGGYGRATPDVPSLSRFVLLLPMVCNIWRENVININVPKCIAMTRTVPTKNSARDVRELIPWIDNTPMRSILENAERIAELKKTDETEGDTPLDLPDELKGILKTPNLQRLMERII